MPLSNVQRQRQHVEKASDLLIAPEKISKARKACERDFKLFCTTYLKHMFPLPDSDDQIDSKNRIEHAVLKGGRHVEAAPRGDGKTQRAKAGAIWAALYGHWRYGVVLAATEKKGKQLMKEIAQELADNDKLRKDWPGVCVPMREAFLNANRARSITINGGPARMECSTGRVVFPTWDGAKVDIGGTVIEGAGILAAMRGLRFTTASGETLRPDGVLIDDIQTRKSASSAEQCEQRLATICGDVMKMAGPDKEISAVCMVTVIKRNDAADQLLNNKLHPEWRGVRKKMVYEWPTAKNLWDEYARLRRGGLLAGDSGNAANDFYASKRTEMDAGARIGWVSRFRKERGECSALQCAYNLLIDDGEEAFWAECQNEPIEHRAQVYEITPELVASRLNQLPAGESLHGARCLSAFTDVNKGFLWWAVCGWGGDMTGNVLGYGPWPADGSKFWNEKEPKGETEAQAIYRALTELGGFITRLGSFVKGGVPQRLDCWMIDIGYNDKTVYQFAKTAQVPTMIVPSRGWTSRTYRPTESVRVGDHWHVNGNYGKSSERVLVHDADWQRLQTQTAFLLPNGSPGGITLSGNQSLIHKEFAKGICAERLAEYIKGDRFDHYHWEQVPGQRNEALDCVVGCRVGGLYVLGVSGQISQGAPDVVPPKPPEAKSEPPKPAVVANQPLRPDLVRPMSGPVAYDNSW